jgi:NCAIR mutase (PurE)-related protein
MFCTTLTGDINASGPRKLNEGTAEIEHRVLKVLDDPENSFTEMHVTLLAAGFVIGPSGQSVRAICENSGAHIQSSTRSGVQGPYRLFAIVGSDQCRANAQHIIESAVSLYQQLFRGIGSFFTATTRTF